MVGKCFHREIYDVFRRSREFHIAVWGGGRARSRYENHPREGFAVASGSSDSFYRVDGGHESPPMVLAIARHRLTVVVGLAPRAPESGGEIGCVGTLAGFRRATLSNGRAFISS